MKPCRECKKEVSTDAKTCPNCGKANPTQAKISTGAGCLIGLIVLVIIGSLTNSGGGGKPPTAATIKHPSSGPARLVGGGVIIWKSRSDMDEGLKMLSRGNPQDHLQEIAPYVQCAASGHDSVTVLDMEMGLREIVIESKENHNCRGWVVMESVIE